MSKHKKCILVVDDRDLSRKILKDLLEAHVYKVLEAANGQECVQIALREKPDLILLDLKIPVIDGWEAARLLKSNSATRKIPIIATSAQVLPADRELAMTAGCDDFVIKPLHHQTLLEKIQTFLGK